MKFKRFKRELFDIDAPHGSKGWIVRGQALNNRWVMVASGIEQTDSERGRAMAAARRRAEQ